MIKMMNEGLTIFQLQNMIESRGIRTRSPKRFDFIEPNKKTGIYELRHYMSIKPEKYNETKSNLSVLVDFDDQIMANFLVNEIIKKSPEPKIYQYLNEVLKNLDHPYIHDIHYPRISKIIDNLAKESKDKNTKALLTKALTAPTSMTLRYHEFYDADIIMSFKDAEYAIYGNVEDLLGDSGKNVYESMFKKGGKDKIASFSVKGFKNSGKNIKENFLPVLDKTIKIAKFADKFYNKEGMLIKAKEYITKLF